VSDRQAQWKYSILLAFFAVVGYFVLVWPMQRRVSRVEVQIVELTEQLRGAEREAGYVLEAMRVVDDLHALWASLKPIPVGDDLPGLRRSIGGYIEKLPFTTHDFKRGRDLNNHTALSLSLSIDAVGEFGGVFDLLQYIETLPRLVRVRGVAIERTSNQANEIHATVSIDAYYRRGSDEDALLSHVEESGA